MKYNQIHNVLDNQVSALTDTLESVNSGGCGHVALAMHRALNVHSIPSKIVLVGAYGYNARDVNSLIEYTGKSNLNDAYHHLFDHEIESWGDIRRDTLNGHVCVLFDGKTYDGEGETSYQAISEHITVPTMQRFLTIDSCWNGTFKNTNIGTNVPVFLQDFFQSIFAKHLTE